MALARSNTTSDVRVAGGVAGIAEASTSPAQGAGYGMSGGSWLDPSTPSFWVGVMYCGAWAWLLWIRFIYRGATF